MSSTRLKDRAKCLSRQYKSQNTRLLSSLASVLVTEKVSWSRLQEHKGLAHGETEAEHLSSSRFSSRERASRTALFHHLKQSLLKSPPETAIDKRINVSTSSITPAGSFLAVVKGCVEENWKPLWGWSASTRKPPRETSAFCSSVHEAGYITVYPPPSIRISIRDQRSGQLVQRIANLGS